MSKEIKTFLEDHTNWSQETYKAFDELLNEELLVAFKEGDLLGTNTGFSEGVAHERERMEILKNGDQDNGWLLQLQHLSEDL